MRTVCNKDMCVGCMACISICKKDAIRIYDSMNAYNAVIDSEKCINCGACERICQNNQLWENLRKPIEWHQGWARKNDVRARASSGGAAAAIMYAFVRNGGIVCSCTYKNGVFGFEFAKKCEEIEKFSGSKYIKSNPDGIYETVKNFLKSGRKILFLGLPCQVAAVKNYVGEKRSENLYTIDLICHGTPSPKVMEIFLKQYHMDMKQQTSYLFRDKDMFQIAVSDKYIIHKGAADCYSLAFLNSLTYTENCYSCKYACLKRISDITLGDSWGTELEVVEQKKGVSLVLVQTEKGKKLLKDANMHLEKVDLEKAIKANHQLEHPSMKCAKSEQFWQALKKGKKFNLLVLQQFPRQCMRQSVKRLLLSLKIIHR